MERTVFKAILLFAVLVGAACAETQTEDSLINYSKSAQMNYDRGMDEFADDDCSDANKYFQVVRQHFPYSRYAALAELRLADCSYMDGKYSEAAVAYQQFEKTHPSHIEAHNAAFRQGLSYYRMVPIDWFLVPPPWERDQAATRDAVNTLKNFVRNYPTSPNIPWARELIADCEQALARHEIFAAEFYRREGKLKAASERLKAAMERYPDSILAPEALYLLGLTYLELQRYDAAVNTFKRLVTKYPSTHQSRRAEVMLKEVDTQGRPPLPRGSDGQGDSKAN